MIATVATGKETQRVIASIGGIRLPLELDRIHLLGCGGKQPLRFRFAFHEVPFSCIAERRDGRSIPALTGDFGVLPYTAEGPERRRAVQTAVAAAQQRSGLRWSVTPQRQIEVKGDIGLGLPLTPMALVAGTVALFLRAGTHLELLREFLTAPAQRGGSVTT